MKSSYIFDIFRHVRSMVMDVLFSFQVRSQILNLRKLVSFFNTIFPSFSVKYLQQKITHGHKMTIL